MKLSSTIKISAVFLLIGFAVWFTKFNRAVIIPFLHPDCTVMKYAGVGCDMTTGMFFLDSVSRRGDGEVSLKLETTTEPIIKEEVKGIYLDSLTIAIPAATSFHEHFCSLQKNPPAVVETREIIKFYLTRVRITIL